MGAIKSFGCKADSALPIFCSKRKKASLSRSFSIFIQHLFRTASRQENVVMEHTASPSTQFIRSSEKNTTPSQESKRRGAYHAVLHDATPPLDALLIDEDVRVHIDMWVSSLTIQRRHACTDHTIRIKSKARILHAARSRLEGGAATTIDLASARSPPPLPPS